MFVARNRQANHPTMVALLDATVALLESKTPDEITVEDVLTTSGISSGSLYHHFGDLNKLIDAAMVVRFARGVDWSINVLGTAMAEARDRTDLVARLHQITLQTQSPDRRDVRAERVLAIARATASPRFREALAPEQARLTHGIAEVWAGLQTRGLVAKSIDAQAGSLFIQAYTLGLALNDVSDNPVPFDAWVAVIDAVVNRTLVDVDADQEGFDTDFAGLDGTDS